MIPRHISARSVVMFMIFGKIQSKEERQMMVEMTLKEEMIMKAKVRVAALGRCKHQAVLIAPLVLLQP